MSAQLAERTTTAHLSRFQRLGNWFDGQRGLQDYLRGGGQFLNSDALQELGKRSSAEEFYKKTLEPLVGSWGKVDLASGTTWSWTGRVKQVVKAWTRNDSEEQKHHKLTGLFKLFSTATPLYTSGNEHLRLKKENKHATEERIDTTGLFASSFTPSEFALLFLMTDINAISESELMNIIFAFDYNLSNQLSEISPVVIRLARGKLNA